LIKNPLKNRQRGSMTMRRIEMFWGEERTGATTPRKTNPNLRARSFILLEGEHEGSICARGLEGNCEMRSCDLVKAQPISGTGKL